METIGPGILPPGVTDVASIAFSQMISFLVGALSSIAFVIAASQRW